MSATPSCPTDHTGRPPDPGRPLHADLDDWAAITPERVAIAWSTPGTGNGSGELDGSVTYGRLSRWSNQIGAQLVSSGVGRGDRVLICMEKGPEAIAAMLGTVKAGAAYVPLDPDSPATRSRLIVDAAEPAAILAQPSAFPLTAELVGPTSATPIGTLAPLVPAPDPGTANLPGLASTPANLPGLASTPANLPGLASTPANLPGLASTPANLPGLAFTGVDVEGQDPAWEPVPAGAGDLAHVLFTSGSTGVPKGVQILHRNVMAFVDWAIEHFRYRPDDRVSGHSPLHFDLSTFDLYAALAAGATLHPVPAETNINPADLARFIRHRSLTQWFSVPSALNLMVRFEVIEPGDFPHLRRLMWCGEVLPTPTLVELMERLPHVEFTNLYGPTEATIASSWYRVPAIPDDPTAPFPIGTACAGETLVVLDDDDRPVADGETGELNIGGVGLSPGYWRDQDKTDQAFRYVTSAGQRLYRTGDLARRDPDGNIVYLGRTDSQIKSRGYRIELGEIESALNTLDDLIDQAAVVAIESDGFEGAMICAAYVTASEGQTGVDEPGLRPRDLKARLGELVPSYMIPRRWMALDELPTNVNGKIDRPVLRSWFLDGGPRPRRADPVERNTDER